MSGKQSKRVRKEKKENKVSKKLIAGAAAAIIGSAPVVAEGGEFLISVFPHFSFPVLKFDESLSTGFGGGLQLTYRPNPYFNLFVQGDYKFYTFDTKQAISNINLIGGTLGAGYHLPVTDRLGIDFNAGIGYYNSFYENGQGAQKSKKTMQGFSVSGGIFVSYKINPTISVFAGGAANHYAYKNSKFITSADVNPGVTFNLTKAFSNKTNVSVNQDELKPVFPVFYSWYNDNPFGSVEVTNNEDVTITDVNVYFFQPQYMSQPKECGKKAQLKKGESFNVDLSAFFNEQMLELNEKNDTMSTITVEYKYLGKKSTATFPMVVPVYGRNNMSWEDDRCASAFVSSKDPAAMWFAKYVVSTIRDNIRSGLTTNIQYAMGIFDALDQFGINYVKDPTSAFEDNVGTASIDFLQFPYQTLMYRGGDCDDLSILVCSLLESVGIKTAFITIPGHIFMAFDSGFTVEEAKEYFLTLDEFIVDGNKVWVPLEITLTDEGFNKAWHKGAWEWNTAARNGAAALYKMEDSWKIYKPVNVPGAVARFSLPEETYVARLFSHSVDEFIIGQIMPQIAWHENRIAMNPSAQNYNDFGVLYARYGLFEQAEKQFRLARNLDYKPSVLNTANLYYSIKDYDRAINWYKEVLNSDSENLLAMIGLARCAYEVGDYKECDHWYGTVFNKDIALARKYSYLGAFESTSGRSFSLADRLEKTIWITGSTATVNTAANENEGVQVVENQLANQTTDVIVKMPKPEAPAESLQENPPMVALAPVSAEEKEPEPEEEKLEGGDGDGHDDVAQSAVAGTESAVAGTQSAVVEPVETTDIESAVADTESAVVEPVETTDTSLADTDLRVKPEDDTKSLEDDTKVAEVDNEVAEGDTKSLEDDTKSPEEDTKVAEGATKSLEDDTEPETYVGISSQLNVNFISVEDLIALAEDTIKEQGETIEDISIPVDDTVDFERYVEEQLAETSAVAGTESAEAGTESAVAGTQSAVAGTQSAAAGTQSPVVEPVETTDTSLADADTKVADAATKSPDADTTALALEKLPANPASATSSVTTDVPMRAVPRFTVQPSAEWAPESAYTAETIPGMKPFEEEMGNYQNEKAFLYKENEFDFAVNPGEEIKEEKKEDTTELASLEVNPFSSFLSEKEAAKVEAITNFKIEEVVKPVEKAAVTQGQSGADLRVKPEDDIKSPEDDRTQTAVVEALETTTVTSNDIPVPEVIPQPSLATSEETAVAVPVVEKEVVSTSSTTADAGPATQNESTATQSAMVEALETTEDPHATTPSASTTTQSVTAAPQGATSKKSNGIIFAAIAGAIGAAAAALFINKKRKGK